MYSADNLVEKNHLGSVRFGINNSTLSWVRVRIWRAIWWQWKTHMEKYRSVYVERKKDHPNILWGNTEMYAVIKVNAQLMPQHESKEGQQQPFQEYQEQISNSRTEQQSPKWSENKLFSSTQAFPHANFISQPLWSPYSGESKNTHVQHLSSWQNLTCLHLTENKGGKESQQRTWTSLLTLHFSFYLNNSGSSAALTYQKI